MTAPRESLADALLVCFQKAERRMLAEWSRIALNHKHADSRDAEAYRDSQQELLRLACQEVDRIVADEIDQRILDPTRRGG